MTDMTDIGTQTEPFEPDCVAGSSQRPKDPDKKKRTSRKEVKVTSSSAEKRAVARVPRPLIPVSDRLYPIPPLPDNARQCNKFFFFGWTYNKDWFYSLARAEAKALGRPVQMSHTAPAANRDALRRYSDYWYIYNVTVVAEEGMKYYQTYRSPISDELWTDAVMVFVNSTRFAHRRPTNGQMEKLIGLFSRPPTWLKDAFPMKDFHEYKFLPAYQLSLTEPTKKVKQKKASTPTPGHPETDSLNRQLEKLALTS